MKVEGRQRSIFDIAREGLNYLRVLNARHFCPVCRRKVARFGSFPENILRGMHEHGFDITKHVMETQNYAQYSCPHCGAADRLRLYALFLEMLHGKNRLHGRLLDFSPSPCFSSYMSDVAGLDYVVSDWNEGRAAQRIDIQNMCEIETDSFDAVICSHVLEHVPDDMSALREIYRILKNEGWAILMAPISLSIDETLEEANATSEGDRWRLYGQGDHLRLYSQQGFRRAIVNAGFRLTMHGVEFWSRDTYDRLGLAETSVLYVGWKDTCDEGA